MTKDTPGKIDPRVKDVLKLIAIGGIITVSLLMPGPAGVAGMMIREYQKRKENKEDNELQKYNLWRLRQVIKRLDRQKVVEINNGVVKITEKGKQKLLRYDLDEMSLNEKIDGKWRIVIYDVSELNKRGREIFRYMLKRLKFLQLQESVYLTPFPCESEIEYLRQRFRIGNDVKIITATGIEQSEAYKKYFGL